MKKLLSLLGAVGLVATSTATVVSCGTTPIAAPTDEEFAKDTFELGEVAVSPSSANPENVVPLVVMSGILHAAAKNNAFLEKYGDILTSDENPDFDSQIYEMDNTGIFDTRADKNDKNTQEAALNFLSSVNPTDLTFMNWALDIGSDDSWDIIAHFTFTITIEAE
jgi:hypothetical protein